MMHPCEHQGRRDQGESQVDIDKLHEKFRHARARIRHQLAGKIHLSRRLLRAARIAEH